MHLLVGLGNPGSQYANNRHNIGFVAVDAIHARHGFSPWRSRFSAQVSEGRIGTHKVLLAKPEIFMNLSGQAAGEIARFYKLEPSDVTTIHDELDLDPGRTRIKTGGGHGGHNGLKSLDAHLGKDYRRIRLGIGHPGHKDLVSGYVLKDFPKADQPWVDALTDEIARSIDLALDGKDSDLNARLNEATASFRPEKAKKADQQPAKPKPTGGGQSHIRQARQTTKPNMPTKGPMADMLKKLLGNKD
ncbi:aminoacyl-tRNA hydrolase [Ahrensia marina]|uniref:aminoacyl-tRNA hydrolase n=1 Tax=Ahrensia marina TaxID=1514904 RepID=UPI0035CF156E